MLGLDWNSSFSESVDHYNRPSHTLYAFFILSYLFFLSFSSFRLFLSVFLSFLSPFIRFILIII